MGRVVFIGVATVLAAVVLWLQLGESYKDRAVELRRTKAEIEVRGEALSSWADELDAQEAALGAQQAEIEAREAAVEETREEVEKREAALEKLARELEERTKSSLQATAPAIVGKYAIVIDADTGIPLFEKNADAKTAVASTQKLMTGLIVAEGGELDTLVRVEVSDTRVEPTIINFKPGEEYRRGELLRALLMKSGNDVALCLARDHAGSTAAFAEGMNTKAREIGMAHTLFKNPHGLTVEGQYSTARDMAKLAREVYGQPVLKEIVSTPKAIFEMADGTPKTLINTNRILRECPLCDGMKTGYTMASGHCLVCSGGSGEKRRIVVVLGSDGRSVWRDSRALLEWALDA